MKAFSYLYFFLFFIAISLFFQSCDEKNANSFKELDPAKLFVYEVYPLLESKCFACHGNDQEDIEGEFDIRSLEGMLQGGESGHAALQIGKAKESPLYLATTWKDPDFQMPPKENDRLTGKQVDMLEAWIDGGAPWPDETKRAEILAAGDWDWGDEVVIQTSGALSESWANRRYKKEDLWAFYPLQEVEVPWKAVGEQDAHPIDAFIQQKLKEEGIKPASKADKRTLIRRATYDLIGLPPTPEEVDDFLADNSPDAYEKLIERLLESPHYGEQWGRHWLDVVRYADTDGFANDYARPNAWRYRDYVIRAFNDDKPYDQFIMEQIAGDEIDPQNPEMLIAAGFLRMGPWEHTGMSVAAETRQFYLDDVTNGVGETFLSMPLRCARCHDHKFDPIPTKDYYRIQAVFASTQFADRRAPFLPVENLAGMEAEQEQIKAWLTKTQAEQELFREKEENAAKAWYKARGKKYLPKRQRMKLHESQRPPRYLGLTFQDLGYRKVLQKHAQTLNRELGRYESMAFTVYNGPDKVQHSARPFRIPENLEGEAASTFILTGGSVYAKSDEVTPGILSAIPSIQYTEDDKGFAPLDQPLTTEMGGRRLKFAAWLTQEDHPIVLRSIANRIWQYHFGKGLAENSNNFGATGKKPTHPELLDWLAQYFVEKGWSIKAIHRLIMTSETYQRSSKPANLKQLNTKDPDNKWLAVYSPRRLEAEELRDAMLFVSGELNPTAGGIPIRPEVNMEVALQPRHIMGSVARAYQPSRTPEERNRRTIYAERRRGMPDPMLEVFNQPGPDLSCERRTTSAVSPQAFTLFNGKNTRDRAIAMAIRLEKNADDLETKIKSAIELAWNRPPTSKEVAHSKAYLEEMLNYHLENTPQKEEYPTEITRHMFEEMTGESFEYTEQLDVFKDYVPDAKPWDVSPQTRALADFCLVLFNSNEFVYVY